MEMIQDTCDSICLKKLTVLTPVTTCRLLTHLLMFRGSLYSKLCLLFEKHKCFSEKMIHGICVQGGECDLGPAPYFCGD